MHGGEGDGVLHSVDGSSLLSGCTLGSQVPPGEVVRDRGDRRLVDRGVLATAVRVIPPLGVVDRVLLGHIRQRVLGFPQGSSKTGFIVPDVDLARGGPLDLPSPTCTEKGRHNNHEDEEEDGGDDAGDDSGGAALPRQLNVILLTLPTLSKLTHLVCILVHN